MTESLSPRSALRDPGAAARRPVVVATLLVALLGAMSVIVTVWAPPTGASRSQGPTSAPGATEPNEAPASTAPPLVEQRPLPGDTPPTDPVEKGDALNNALPRPNSGHKPYYQGDRGTGSQYAVLGAMVLALVVIASLVYRQSRRSHTRWTATSPMASTPDQPIPTDPGRSDEAGPNGPASESP